jgi:hypothetical protein
MASLVRIIRTQHLAYDSRLNMVFRSPEYFRGPFSGMIMPLAPPIGFVEAMPPGLSPQRRLEWCKIRSILDEEMSDGREMVR